MKRVIIKKAIDKKFLCPYCKCDLRKEGINFTEYRIEYVNCDTTAYYDDDGSCNNFDYNDSETTDSEENGYGDYFYCGGCGKELEVSKDITDDLDLSELWEKINK